MAYGKWLMANGKYITISYMLLAICLFLYSYTQVDLNLTLSQFSIWQTIQKSFQQIGWFNRPLSTSIYLILLFFLFTNYYLLLRLAKKGAVTVGYLWKLVVPVSIILLFAYNAFSYDLFNYMFDARIVTYHHMDPYGYKALDFPQDPWINFMRWTHRTYPYGTVWLWFTVPLSFMGMQFFLPTLFLFKGLMVGAFLGTVYFIGKILDKLAPQEKLFGMAAFALNPLVIIESLVSAHNDIVMIFFALTGIYFLITRKYIFALLALLASAYIKFINDPLPDIAHYLAPLGIGLFVLGVWWWQKKGKEIDWNMFFVGGGILMITAIFFASQRTEFQPWYFIWVLPFVALMPARKELVVAASIVSLGLLLHYVPFLYTGNWDPPIPMIKMWLTVVAILGSLIVVGLPFFMQKRA